MLRRLALALAVTLLACKSPPPAAPSSPIDDQRGEAPPLEVPPPTAELRGGAIVLSEPIEFEAGSDRIAASSEDVMAALAALLDERSDLSLLRIESHSDAQGVEEVNQQRTEARAIAIARWLVGNGVDCSRVIAVGFGETKPIADNQTADGRAHNRRIELVPAALRGTPIGGMPVDGGGQVAGDACN